MIRWPILASIKCLVITNMSHLEILVPISQLLFTVNHVPEVSLGVKFFSLVVLKVLPLDFFSWDEHYSDVGFGLLKFPGWVFRI